MLRGHGGQKLAHCSHFSAPLAGVVQFWNSDTSGQRERTPCVPFCAQKRKTCRNLEFTGIPIMSKKKIAMLVVAVLGSMLIGAVLFTYYDFNSQLPFRFDLGAGLRRSDCS